MRADETVEERERQPRKGRRGNLTITVMQQDAALPTLELFSPPILYSLILYSISIRQPHAGGRGLASYVYYDQVKTRQK
jgi:hypothetical protein